MDNTSDQRYSSLAASLEKYGQGHVLQWWEELDQAGRDQLAGELEELDLEEMEEMYRKTCLEPEDRDMSSMEPVEASLCESMVTSSQASLETYTKVALTEAAQGRVGVLLLAGGQGTRLGVGYPKGMYNIGLPSNKTLYQIQIERILRLQELAWRLTGERGKIQMYIMTSEATREPTLDFLRENDYFGLCEDQLTIFEQRVIPALDMAGKFILETKSKLARSPDGNGGLYWALRRQGVLEDLERKDVRFLHVYCVDNVLVKVADPVFMGYCISKNAESGNKVCEKILPEEAVGVVCKLAGRIQVVEYSEISAETSRLTTPDGKLTYKGGNICNHFFTRDFLKRVCDKHERDLPHHIAKKKIPFTDPKTGVPHKPEISNGMKLEKFVFDVFQFADSFVLWECVREDEFSPLKNGDSAAAKDTPSTARMSVYDLHRRYMESAGAIIENQEDNTLELSPLLTYSGEGLEQFKGKHIKLPFHLNNEKFTNGS